MTTNNLAMVIYNKQRRAVAPLLKPLSRPPKKDSATPKPASRSTAAPKRTDDNLPSFCSPKIRARKYDMF